MRLTRAEEIAIEMLDTAGLTAKGWTFRFNKLKTCFGLCYVSEKIIEVSGEITKLNKKRDFVDTMIHEIGHALCKHVYHNEQWKSFVINMGGSVDVLCSDSIKLPEGKYYLKCRACGYLSEYVFYRYPKKKRICQECRGRKRTLSVVIS